MSLPDIYSLESAATPGPEGGKYVYCIVRSDRSRDFGAIGIGGGQKVFTVAFQDLAAVVSDTPIVIYDPTRDNVLAHEFVNETVMKEFTVIPMSFGTVFRSEDDVTELLRSTYQGVLGRVGQDAGQDRVRAQGAVGPREGDQQSGARERRDPAVEGRDQPAHDDVDVFRPDAAGTARGLGAGGDGRALRGRHPRRAQAGGSGEPVEQADRGPDDLERGVLVDRAQEQAFDERVKETSRKYEDVLSFKYSGPWPPYNFVNIKLKLEKAD
jgi:hypothetical protein